MHDGSIATLGEVIEHYDRGGVPNPQLDPEIRRRGTGRLRRDLETGAWDAHHGELRTIREIDIGYRLLVAGHLS